MYCPKQISVIVPAFNQEKYIGRCLRSLLSQTISHDLYEIIVIDDGSYDNTAFSIDQFSYPSDNLIKKIVNDSNRGLPYSLNRGISESQGKYIIRVDSDDYVNSNYLSIMSYYLDSNATADAVACDYILVDDDEASLGRFCSKENPIGCGIMFRRDPLLDIGLYDESFLANEERDLFVRFTKKYCIDHLALPMYRYRRHASNMTNNKEVMSVHDALFMAKHSQ